MGYSLDPLSANCYPGTTVLINRFGIREEEKLNEVESVLSSARYAEWLSSPRCRTFDFAHYRAIHRHLFSDLYDWAGEIRTVDISKKGTVFCAAEKIETQADLIFRHLKQYNAFTELPRDIFVASLVDLYCATNELHPFREGNGRTQRLFLSQLTDNAGYCIRFAEIDPDLLMIATIQASHGVTDLLKQLFTEYIQKKPAGSP